MVLVVTWQVVTRFIIREPSSFTEELSRFLLIWIGLLGASYALRTNAHLGIDLLSQKLEGFNKRVLIVLVNILIILFSLFIMVLGGFRLVQLTFTLNQISASMGIKMGYVYFVLPLSGVIMIYYSILSIVEILMTKSEGKTERSFDKGLV
jgi:TRAP-type C4-dicarboxylate transport system permease small subunit